MKWPKINVRRMDVERVLIACSAALVLLLSVQSRNVEFEPYEEPLEEIPVAEMVLVVEIQLLEDLVLVLEHQSQVENLFLNQLTGMPKELMMRSILHNQQV